jgi:hypothetical protein
MPPKTAKYAHLSDEEWRNFCNERQRRYNKTFYEKDGVGSEYFKNRRRIAREKKKAELSKCSHCGQILPTSNNANELPSGAPEV